VVTANELLWILGGGAFSLLLWALSKVFDRIVQDIAGVRTHLHKIADVVQSHELKIALLEREDNEE
jgi:hypothetical protein